jgi:hypothetical protein
MEDENSVQGTEGSTLKGAASKISGGPLARFVLSEEELQLKILEFSNGYTSETAAKLTGNYSISINPVNFGAKKVEGVKVKATEEIYGRNLFEGVTSLLMKQLSDVFMFIVVNNFDISSFQASRNLHRSELLAEKTSVEKEIFALNVGLKEPKRDYFEFRSNGRVKTHLEDARQDYRTSLTTEEKKADEAVPGFETSQFYRAHVVFREEAKSIWEAEYVAAVEKHQEGLEAHAKLQTKLSELERQIKLENIAEQVSFAIVTAIGMISNKIRDAVENFYPELKQKLQGTAKFPNGNVITDPYTALSLPGLYMILYVEYNKANIAIFCKQLLDLLDDKTYEDPTKAISEVNAELKQWNQLDLWVYMDQDKLFTVALIRKLSNKSDLRKRAIEQVLDFAKKLEIGEISVDSLGKFPIFDYLREWLIDVYQRTYEMNRNQSNSKPFNRTGGNSSNGSSRFYGTESAAVASTTTTTTGRTSSVKMVDRIINREVGRDEMLFITNVENGKLLLYTATKFGCAKCNEKDESKKHPKPRCYLGKCTKCNLYGHRAPDCHQKIENSDDSNSQTAEKSTV